ncbi:serine/arginine-rich splicing factor 1-like [Oscarella lobularis]|uniref:serine/arginine-rich splicing factor 1-like n=1 Tax=Oscarella lobularis TaxID=121494 RepID=UPI00331377F4
MSRRDRNCRIYVGNLPHDVREKDVEDLFYKYGKIVTLELKNKRDGAPFAFIDFDDDRDADDAVSSRDGYEFDGHRLRVEPCRGTERGRGGVPLRDRGGYDRYSGGGGGGGGYGGRRGGGGGGGGGGGSPSGGSRSRSGYRVKVTGLPTTGSWQDLKDHFREAGDVCYTDVYRDGTGVVEFARARGVDYAVRHLNDTKFRSHEGETSRIRVVEDGASSSSRRSRSPRRSRSRSPKRSRSPRGGGGGGGGRRYSRSRSRSPRKRSRSYSPRRRSRSRSRS